jgi:DNA repair protein RecO (recombination protein O)
MPRMVRTEALVLRSRDVDEADREVTLLCRREGLLRARVKGARKVRSRLAGALDVLGVAEVVLYRGAGRATVTGAVAGPPLPALGRDPVRFAAAALWAEALEQTLPEGEVLPGVYALAVGGLDLIARAQRTQSVVSFLLVKLLMILGYAPALGACAACGGSLDAPPYGFSAALGGVLCRDCAGRGSPLSPPALSALSLLARGREEAALHLELSPAVHREVRQVLLAHLTWRTERPLRSARVLASLLGEAEPAPDSRETP